jgi:hypothetical protein
MPYFVYRLTPGQRPNLLETFAKYPDARNLARRLRAELPAGSADTIHMIFAEDPNKARLLLTDTRNPKTDGDD